MLDIAEKAIHMVLKEKKAYWQFLSADNIEEINSKRNGIKLPVSAINLFFSFQEQRKRGRKDGKQIEITGKRVTVPTPVYDVDFGGWTSPKEEQPEKVLAVLPEYGICRLVDEVTYRVRKVRELKVAGDKDSFKANIMRMLMDDDGCRCEFWRDDELVAYVDADYYVYIGEEEVK